MKNIKEKEMEKWWWKKFEKVNNVMEKIVKRTEKDRKR